MAHLPYAPAVTAAAPLTTSSQLADARPWRVETGLSFLTGVELDHRVLRPDGSAQLVRLVERRDPVGACLRVLNAPGRADRRFFAVADADHGTAVLPEAPIVADTQWLLTACDAESTFEGWQLTLASAALHDYGVGTLVLSWEPVPGHDVPDDLAKVVGRLNDEAARRAAGAVAAMTDALAQTTTGCSLRLPDLVTSTSPPPGDAATDTVLWVWNHCLLTAPDGKHPEVAAHAAALLCPNGSTPLRHRDHAYAAGVYTSVTCSRPGAQDDAVALSRALARQDSWWTLFWSLDRRLLDVQFALDSTIVSGTSVRALEVRASRLAGVAERVRLYQSRVDSMLMNTGARELDAWQATAAAWTLDVRRAVVDRKLEQLDDALRAAVEHVVRVRSARISLMIYVFTAFGVIASAVALAQFAQGSTPGALPARVAVLTASAAVALLAVALSLRVWVSVRHD